MKTTTSGILGSLLRPAMRFFSGLILAAMPAAALLAAAGPAQAATVSVSASENNGPVNVTASATFYNGETGYLKIYNVYGTLYKTISGAGSASFSETWEGANKPSGDYTVRVTATDSQGTVEATDTFTIQNPVSLSGQADGHPTGPLNVTASASFLARAIAGKWTGDIIVRRKLSTSSTWHSVTRSKTYTTPDAAFSCEDTSDGPFDVALWTNGDYDIQIEARGANYESIFELKTTTIQNPISLSGQADSHPTGPLNVTASATFLARRTAGDKTGDIIVRRKLSTSSTWHSVTRSKTYTTPDATFSCEDTSGGPFDVATWTNGNYDIQIEALGVYDGSLTELKTTTIDNTPKVTASCPQYVSGEFDITGSAVFTEVRDDGSWKGTVYINIDRQSTSTSYGAKTKSYYKGDSPDFSYAEMAGAPLNADTLGHGEHIAYIIAQAKNGTWSDWYELPFTTGPPEADGSGNIKFVPQQ